MTRQFLSDLTLSVIALLRDEPVSEEMKVHLMGLFGKGGLVDEIERIQEKRWTQCPYAGTRNCGCGACEPYRQGPLLDEVLAEIHAFECGEFIFDKKGLAIKPPEEELPF